MIDFTIITIAVSIVILSWAVIKISEKLDKHVKKFKKFDEALKKNATSKILVSPPINDKEEKQEEACIK